MAKNSRPKHSIILSVETSCDETAAAVLEITKQGGFGFPHIRTLSSVVKSQIQLHSKMGGVVPEAAARAHVKNILPVVEKTINDSLLTINDIDYIAVTQGPGLIPSLIVGVEFAKALSFATGIPLLPINHMAGHLYSPFGGENPKSEIRNPPQSFDRAARRMTVPKQNLKSKIPASPAGRLNLKPAFPHIALIVSGGHTMLVLMKNLHEYKVLGQTVDDAAGEAFDKVAKLLNLPYPGGPEVSKLANLSKTPVEFPRPMIHSKDYNFSFSGLKTAVLYFVKDQGSRMRDKNVVYDICAGFQNAVVDVLTAKTMRAIKEFRAKSASLSGGVSANTSLRQSLIVNCGTSAVALAKADKSSHVPFFLPGKGLSTDNAEMIGIAAAVELTKSKPKIVRAITLQADPSLNL